jgi:hypothetical protein
LSCTPATVSGSPARAPRSWRCRRPGRRSARPRRGRRRRWCSGRARGSAGGPSSIRRVTSETGLTSWQRAGGLAPAARRVRMAS